MRIPKNPSWKWIKDALHERSMTLTKLAELNGLHPSTCRKVKQLTHYRGQALIAEVIGCKPEHLWPDRYPKGKPYVFDSSKYSVRESQKDIEPTDMRAAA